MPGPARAIVWFRSNLRLHDNEALTLAAACSHLLPVYPQRWNLEARSIFQSRRCAALARVRLGLAISGGPISAAPSRSSQRAPRPTPTPPRPQVFDKRIFGARSRWFDQEKTGAHRARFLIEAVEDLRASLRRIGSDLHVAVGKPEDIIPSLCERFRVERVLTQGEDCSEEAEVERGLQRRLAALRPPASLETVRDATMVDARDVPFAVPRGLPEVFTSFRKIVEERSEVRAPLPTPATLPPLPEDAAGARPEPGDVPPLASFRLASPPTPPPAPTSSVSGKPVPPDAAFEGGETAALRRLKEYLWDKDLLKAYKETRDGMLGADYSSKFSPWLAAGCLSARLVYAEVRRYERERVANQSTYWLIFELLWRDFFRFLAAKHGDHLFFRAGIKRTGYAWREDAALFDAWVAGRTGMPLVDAAMRELAATGFMSNRARQNVASYLAKDLGINWQMGAEYFEAVLLDYDPASNWGNWQYVAGVGNDPREDRRFNITKQAKTYDAEGDFVRRWIPELRRLPASRIQREPWTLSSEEQAAYGVTLGVDYPCPSCPAGLSAAVRGGGRGAGRGGGGGGGGAPQKYGGPKPNEGAFGGSSARGRR
eukprot:tig00020965_g16882.t1